MRLYVFQHRRILYLQVDNVFGLFLLFPSIVAGSVRSA
ncbi:hypothetical protein ACLK1T_05335 [Escherichia coli]